MGRAKVSSSKSCPPNSDHSELMIIDYPDGKTDHVDGCPSKQLNCLTLPKRQYTETPPRPPKGHLSQMTIETEYARTIARTKSLQLNSTEKLALDLNSKLKLRKSIAETHPRSPSERKIGILRRRSEEMHRSKSYSGVDKPNLHMKKQNSIGTTYDAAITRAAIMKSIRRGKPNTLGTGLKTPVKTHKPRITRRQLQESLSRPSVQTRKSPTKHQSIRTPAPSQKSPSKQMLSQSPAQTRKSPTKHLSKTNNEPMKDIDKQDKKVCIVKPRFKSPESETKNIKPQISRSSRSPRIQNTPEIQICIPPGENNQRGSLNTSIQTYDNTPPRRLSNRLSGLLSDVSLDTNNSNDIRNVTKMNDKTVDSKLIDSSEDLSKFNSVFVKNTSNPVNSSMCSFADEVFALVDSFDKTSSSINLSKENSFKRRSSRLSSTSANEISKDANVTITTEKDDTEKMDVEISHKTKKEMDVFQQNNVFVTPAKKTVESNNTIFKTPSSISSNKHRKRPDNLSVEWKPAKEVLSNLKEDDQADEEYEGIRKSLDILRKQRGRVLESVNHFTSLISENNVSILSDNHLNTTISQTPKAFSQKFGTRTPKSIEGHLNPSRSVSRTSSMKVPQINHKIGSPRLSKTKRETFNYNNDSPRSRYITRRNNSISGSRELKSFITKEINFDDTPERKIETNQSCNNLYSIDKKNDITVLNQSGECRRSPRNTQPKTTDSAEVKLASAILGRTKSAGKLNYTESMRYFPTLEKSFKMPLQDSNSGNIPKISQTIPKSSVDKTEKKLRRKIIQNDEIGAENICDNQTRSPKKTPNRTHSYRHTPVRNKYRSPRFHTIK